MSETKDDNLSGVPKMNLMNFEDPQFEDSKYCLTSPRSLEACSRLGVKPVDLLYKPLAEFQEELLPQEVPLRTIYNIYDEHEQNRERKLTLCREERTRIIDEDKGLPPSSRKPTVVKSKRTPTLTTTKDKPRKAKSAKMGKKSLSKSDQNLDQGSLQRQRTAWATSVGHDRVSNDEINNRVKDLHNESVKLRQELLSRKESKSATRGRKKTPSRERPVSARPSTSVRSSINRSYSASDLSLAGTSMLNKTGLSEARPIVNNRLRKALRKSGSKSSPITPRDEKILSLIMYKHEEERADIKEKYLRDIMWERQKKEEEAGRLVSEMRRRRLLAEENRIKSAKKNERVSRVKKDEQRLVREQERLLDESHAKWATRYNTVQKSRDLQTIEKMEKEQLRKRIQESNVKALEKEEAEIKDLIIQNQSHQVMTAAQKKDARLMEESLRTMMSNRHERSRFEERWDTTLKETQSALDLLATSMDHKDSLHKSKYEQLLQRRDNEITLSRLDREKKALQAKLTQQQQDSEMEEWRDSILTSREYADQHAKETLAQTIERKARKAHEERVRKEREQKKNIKKVQQEVKAWTKQTEDMIDTKDRKSNTIQMEKDLTIQQSRNLAASSHKLRDSLRNKYGGETFDQKAFKADMYNKFETGTTFLSAQKNSSHIKLH